MSKILALAWKELYTFFRNRNLILLMFATPLALATITGLAFGDLGGSDAPNFADIAVAVVNLDEGVDLSDELNLPALGANSDALPFRLNDILRAFGGDGGGLGALSENGVALNFGDQIAGILLSQPAAGATPLGGADFDITEIECALLEETEASGAGNLSAGANLDELLDATAVADAERARAGVDSGEYAAAVIIPPEFSRRMAAPLVALDEDGRLRARPVDAAGGVEVYANNGRPISARIVHSIVAGIVNQFERVNVALNAALATSVNTLLDNFDLQDVDQSGAGMAALLASPQNLDAAAFDPLGCLLTPGANNITIARQPLDALQQAPSFARIIVPIGASQAVFFALFTGVFGIHSIYEERRQWTLQRLIVSPTPTPYLLAGKLLGNLVIVLLQILILLAALTLIASIVIGAPTLVWGTNLGAVVLVTLALALCVTGMGVLVVGLARTPEQVTLIGPMINISLGVLGGAFGGFILPESVAQFSLIYWGVDAFIKLAAAHTGIAINLLVLFGQGIALFLLGTWLFKRRLAL